MVNRSEKSYTNEEVCNTKEKINNTNEFQTKLAKEKSSNRRDISMTIKTDIITTGNDIMPNFHHLTERRVME